MVENNILPLPERIQPLNVRNCCSNGIFSIELLEYSQRPNDLQTVHNCNIWRVFPSNRQRTKLVTFAYFFHFIFKRASNSFELPGFSVTFFTAATYFATLQIFFIRSSNIYCFAAFCSKFWFEINNLIFAQWSKSCHSQHTLMIQHRKKTYQLAHLDRRKRNKKCIQIL